MAAPSKPNVIVSYGGRFQPPHLGHYNVYQSLVKKFGKQNVYVTTSNKTEPGRSPLSFQWKKKFLIELGVPSNKILQVKTNYRTDDVLKPAGFKPENTIWIVAIGEKDSGRLGGKYYEKYEEGKPLATADKKAYFYPVPYAESQTKIGGKILSATIIRNILSQDELNKDEYKFLKIALGAPRALVDTIRSQIKLETRIRKGTLLTEGGMGGHMMNLYDDLTLTFGELEQIIKESLNGELNKEEIREKTDGQNLFASYINGQVRLSRNKSQTKNKGANSLGIKDIAKTWGEKTPEVAEAFTEAFKALEITFKKMGKKDLETIFDNGSNWVNLEIIYPKSKNVIDYGPTPQIVFHSIEMTDDSGKKVGENASLNKKLFSAIDKIKPSGNTAVKNPPFMKLKPHTDFSKKTSYFLNKLASFKSKEKASSSDTLGEYYERAFMRKINKIEKDLYVEIPEDIKIKISHRFAYDDKSYKMTDIKKDLKDLLIYNEIKKINDNYKNIMYDLKSPLISLLLELGVEVLQNMETFLSANPDKTTQILRNDIANKIKSISKSKDEESISKMQDILKSIHAAGGFNKIVPSEGIIFTWGDKKFKITGLFAPINQLMGIGKYGR